MKKFLALAFIAALAFSASAQMTFSGYSDFTYDSVGGYSNFTELDWYSPVENPVSVAFQWWTYVSNGAISCDWPQLDIGYTIPDTTLNLSFRLKDYWQLRAAYSINIADWIGASAFIRYRGPFSADLGNLHGEVAFSNGANLGGLRFLTTFVFDDILGATAFGISETTKLGYLVGLGGDMSVKPYVDADYSFTAGTYALNGGIDLVLLKGLLIEGEYKFVTNTWYVLVELSF